MGVSRSSQPRTAANPGSVKILRRLSPTKEHLPQAAHVWPSADPRTPGLERAVPGQLACFTVWTGGKAGRYRKQRFGTIPSPQAFFRLHSVTLCMAKLWVATTRNQARGCGQRRLLPMAARHGNRHHAAPPRGTVRRWCFCASQRDTLIAVGTSGSDISRDNGQSWDSFSAENFNSVSAAPDGSVWAVGPHGAIAKLAGK